MSISSRYKSSPALTEINILNHNETIYLKVLPILTLSSHRPQSCSNLRRRPQGHIFSTLSSRSKLTRFLTAFMMYNLQHKRAVDCQQYLCVGIVVGGTLTIFPLSPMSYLTTTISVRFKLLVITLPTASSSPW